MLILFGVLGAWRGLFRQVFSLIAFVLIAACAVPAGVWIAERGGDFGQESVRAVAGARLALSVGIGVCIYVFVKLTGLMLDRRRRQFEADKKRSLTPASRYWGGAVSVVKAAVLCWLVLCFLVTFRWVAPGLTDQVEASWSGRTVRLFNPCERCVPRDADRVAEPAG